MMKKGLTPCLKMNKVESRMKQKLNDQTLNDQTLMNSLVDLVVDTKYEDLPADVVHFAKRHILDTLGAVIAGSAMDGIPSIVSFVREQGGEEESHLPLYGGKLPAAMCAFALGPMARVADLGDAHDEAGHSAEYTLPALIAATGLKETRISGKEFLVSFIIGQEVLIRIGKAYKCVSREQSAGSQGGHYIFGPVAAAAKLLGLDKSQLMSALGMAKCMTQPYDMSMYTPANSMVILHHGFIAQDAINICLLAKRGFRTAVDQTLAGNGGFYSLFTRKDNEADLSAIVNNLGEDWEMTKTMLKPYPACNCTHTSIKGVLEEMKEHWFGYHDIDAVCLDESLINWVIVCQPHDLKWNPRSVSECQFSLPYTAAAALYLGDFFLEAYSPEDFASQEIRKLMERISVKKDQNLPPYAARVKIILKNGKSYSKVYTSASIKGHPENPFTDKELVQKFRMCSSYSCYPLDEAIIERVISTILSLDSCKDIVEELLLPLTPSFFIPDS